MLLNEGMLIFERGMWTAQSPEPHADPNELHRKLGERWLRGGISMKRPCELLVVSRSSSYRALHLGLVQDRALRDATEGIDERHPFYGKRRVQVERRQLRTSVSARGGARAVSVSAAGL